MNPEELKTALLNRSFERAQVLIQDWGDEIRSRMRAASGPAALREIVVEALSFAENHIHLTRVVKAHIGTELQANSASYLYRDAESEQHRWHVRG